MKIVTAAITIATTVTTPTFNSAASVALREVKPGNIWFPTSAIPDKIADDKSWADIPTCKSQGLDVEYLMLRGIFTSPGATQEQVDYYVDLFKKVRETPEWQSLMKEGAFNQTFMTGAGYAKWVETEEQRHRTLMQEAGFLAGQ